MHWGSLRIFTGGYARATSLGGTQRQHWAILRLCGVFVLADDHSVGCFLIKTSKTTIVVISAHARLISAMPIPLSIYFVSPGARPQPAQPLFWEEGSTKKIENRLQRRRWHLDMFVSAWARWEWRLLLVQSVRMGYLSLREYGPRPKGPGPMFSNFISRTVPFLFRLF